MRGIPSTLAVRAAWQSLLILAAGFEEDDHNHSSSTGSPNLPYQRSLQIQRQSSSTLLKTSRKSHQWSLSVLDQRKG
jgi:hypothetical protein